MGDNIDLEAGRNPPLGADAISNADRNSAVPKFSGDPLASPDTTSTGPKSGVERLALFRTLVGIQSANVESEHTRLDPNVGIHKRVVKTLWERRIQYYSAASFINLCLFAQIILGAALTALGAASGSHISIAVLASFNTIIAGVMTYLKGQGLPDRLREDANELRRVREYLEQVERQLMAEDAKVLPEREARLIHHMYNEVRKNAEKNYPNSRRPLDPAKAQKTAIKQEVFEETEKEAQVQAQVLAQALPQPQPQHQSISDLILGALEKIGQHGKDEKDGKDGQDGMNEKGGPSGEQK